MSSIMVMTIDGIDNEYDEGIEDCNVSYCEYGIIQIKTTTKKVYDVIVTFEIIMVMMINVNRTFHSDVTRRVTWSSAATGWQKREIGGHLLCVYALQ